MSSATLPARRRSPWLKGLLVTTLFLVAGMALTRVLFEATFPHLLWLGQPFPVLLISAVIAVSFRLLWGHWGLTWPSAVPLLLNAVYLFDPTVDLVQSRFLFAASLWLVGLLVAREVATPKQWRWLGVAFVVLALLPVYLLTMPTTVGRADTFEFQVVVPQLGIVHPTGYPLYLLLGKLATTLNPFGSVAWRLNLATAVYGLVAAAIVFRIGTDLLRRPAAAVAGAVALGLTPTVWSQAIEAEVYTLHALIVAVALWLMVTLLRGISAETPLPVRRFMLLAFVIGLGLTNHLTSLFLLPGAALTFLFVAVPALRREPKPVRASAVLLGKLLLAFLLPLLLYAYLPLRWAAVNQEPMGLSRFVEWVIGGRFQGSLQLMAWLRDPTRWQVVGRLLLENWGAVNLLLIAAGALWLFWRNWRVALVLLVTWAGFVFYALNYYVPDLAVFLMAAHVVMGIWLGAAFAGAIDLAAAAATRWSPTPANLELADPAQSAAERAMGVGHLVLTLLLLPTLLNATTTWQRVDRSAEDGLTMWGSAVLAQSLAPDAAILADSEKIAPLLYLQRAEGLRPDLDIMVLPDEAAYRAELDARIAAGQTVYLARFLPGLQAVYHLNSAGPLVAVSAEGQTTIPDSATPLDIAFDNDIRLVGIEAQPQAADTPDAARVTLYWQADAISAEPQFVYVRWSGPEGVSPPDSPAGQHPAANYYPTSDWDVGEVVADSHLLPHPIAHDAQSLTVEVALGPAFASAETLDWQPVSTLDLPPAAPADSAVALRAQVGSSLLTGVDVASQTRPQASLPAELSGTGSPDALSLTLQPPSAELTPPTGISAEAATAPSFRTVIAVDTDLPADSYALTVSSSEGDAICGWLQPDSAECAIAPVTISGVALPDDAINYDDQIALLDIDMPTTKLVAGGQWPLTLTWQSLGPIAEDYTIFIQVLDANDQIVGQVDAWPLQGTYPTSQWQPGEVVVDPHIVLLDGELSPGPYRVQIGWYLLGTLRRLPVLDANGSPIDDKLSVPGLTVPQP